MKQKHRRLKTMNVKINRTTIRIVSRRLKVLVDTDLVEHVESQEIIKQLKSLSERNALCPIEPNRLIDRKELSQILGLGISNIKRLEASGDLNIPIKRIGSSIRYNLHDVHRFMNTRDDDI